MFSALSSTVVSGRSSDCTERIRIGESAGLILRIVGCAGKSLGNWPCAASIASSTSVEAASILRFKSNCSVIVLVPSTLVDVICVKSEICANWVSSGSATLDAIVSGLAPGYCVVTVMVGKSTCGSGATGKSG